MTVRKIRCFQDLISIPDKSAPVVTLFSGGLDSSYLLCFLYEAGFTSVMALCVDLGEAVEAEALETTAKRFGAELLIEDRRVQFADRYVKPALKAHAKYLDIYPVSSSLSRPLVAQRAVCVALERNAGAVLHTANQSQNSLRRLNTAISAEDFLGLFGSPYEYSALSREDKARALAGYGLTYYADRKLSGDANIWCREFESGPLDNPEAFTLPEEVFTWSRRQPDVGPCSVSLGIQEGELVQVDGEAVAFADAIAHLNALVGSYGFGRFLGLEHLDEGEKVLEVREAPAAFILMQALRHLETATLSANSIILKQALERSWTLEAVEGRWNSDVKAAAEAGILSLAQRVTGTVRFDINHQSCLPSSIRADRPLYLTNRDTWEIEKARERGTRSRADFLRNYFDETPKRNQKSRSIETRLISASMATEKVGTPLVDALTSDGYWVERGAKNFECWDFYDPQSWHDFATCWDDLLLDEYMRDGGTYRFRRYSQLFYSANDGHLALLPHAPYEQSAMINRLNGGFQRHFEAIDGQFLENRFFQGLMRWMGSSYSAASGHLNWNIKLHPYRIVATERPGEPSPEGLHRDGVDYICSFMVRKCNVNGGETVITDANENELVRFTLEMPGDIMIGDDNIVMHGVSPIQMINRKKSVAYRDVLVVAFTKD
ncbi:argininosuccinate synthase [Bradyrhizobium sp. S3.12.5]|uniref:argininosuccinate synthase-related protein n=1 Tax=Bradyrhizobium sp. S3.12.5 TaxID=3156386 RepID=UPI0033981DAC